MTTKRFIILAATMLSMLTATAQTSFTELRPGRLSVAKNMDLSVRPGDDFVSYSTGRWLREHPLRDDQMSNGAFTDLFEQNQKQIQELILQYATTPQQPGTLGYKIGTLYNQMMDTDRRNADGYQPIMANLEKIRAVQTRSDYQRVTAELDRRGESTMLFGWGVGADQRDADNNIVSISQGGMGLGNRDYYLGDDEQTLQVQAAYKKLGRRLFQMVGYSEAEATRKTEAAYAIEARLAVPSYDNVKLRDVDANYHKMSRQQLIRDFPGIEWEMIFRLSGFPMFDAVDVGQPEPLHEVERILAETPLEDLKSYAEARIIAGAASCLSLDFREAYFEFMQALTGQPEDEPVWKHATNLVSSVLSDAIGQMYCERYFPESSKQRVLKMVGNLQLALYQRINEADWMSLPTKQNAARKLGAFTVKIGYPDKWRDYSGLQVDDKLSLYENLSNISEFLWIDKLERKVGKPVDKSEWHMSPQTINAYYSPTSNEICFPAGILQPPFFDPEADEAFNYGAIGSVIGHEMSHGFDDQGCQFDETGFQRNWWTAEDKQHFSERTKVLEDYFDRIEVIGGKTVNGKLTLGENIGDNGGLNISLTAMHEAGIGGVNEGFTADQRFFLGWARIWASNNREQYMDMLLKQDVHSPGLVRVNGALPHIDAWYKAFDIRKDSKLFIPKSQRAHIW